MAETMNGYTPRMRQHYEDVVRPKLIEEFGYKNAMEVPKIDKIVLNMGVGESTADSKKATVAAADLALIAGQKPVITISRKSIATYKLRENQPIGCKVTLRKSRMYEFIEIEGLLLLDMFDRRRAKRPTDGTDTLPQRAESHTA